MTKAEFENLKNTIEAGEMTMPVLRLINEFTKLRENHKKLEALYEAALVPQVKAVREEREACAQLAQARADLASGSVEKWAFEHIARQIMRRDER